MNLHTTLPAVLVMTRWWASGPVKTRLSADLGQAAAREVYRQMVEQLWAGLACQDFRRMLWISPGTQIAASATWLKGAAAVLAQPDGDLGVRLQTAIEQTFSHDSPAWAAVIGTDAPEIDAAWLLGVGEALTTFDVVLTPSFDGGYALLALKQPCAALFQDIPWSTAEVLAITLQRAKDEGLSVFCTATVRDLDDIHDLRQLQADGWLPQTD